MMRDCGTNGSFQPPPDSCNGEDARQLGDGFHHNAPATLENISSEPSCLGSWTWSGFNFIYVTQRVNWFTFFHTNMISSDFL